MEESVAAALAVRLGMDEEAMDPFTRVLDEEQLRSLDAVIEAALVAEDSAVQRAVEDAVESVPWPVRSAVRALLSGETS